ncbi:MAG: F0F1 ATP synthase subunit A [Huintestinicola sp.]|uniref:F0F1 ATP synthase subunit A n=1 Tax=Huintestinicola sp. TaxID=2981661 RepID=UPI003F04F2B5
METAQAASALSAAAAGFFDTELHVDVLGPRKMITVMNGSDELFSISETVVTGWLLIILLFILIKWLTSDLKVVPTSKKQVLAEWFVTFFNNLVKENMGSKMMHLAPYIATIFTFALTGSLISIFGFRSMTVDINCTGTWAALTFILITFYKIKSNGFGGYLKGFTEPVAVITPINILSEVATPVAMALRMFGNISSGMIISSIVYAFLTVLSNVVYNALALNFSALNYFHIFQVGIPAVLSLYFDFFSGVIQSYVFIMLTMAYVGDAAGKEE